MAKIWQKMKKNLVQLAFNPFLQGTSSARNPGFGMQVSGIRSATIYLQYSISFPICISKPPVSNIVNSLGNLHFASQTFGSFLT